MRLVTAHCARLNSSRKCEGRLTEGQVNSRNDLSRSIVEGLAADKAGPGSRGLAHVAEEEMESAELERGRVVVGGGLGERLTTELP
jgi:hypothetical protein